ncbi:hypothetical protein ACJJTC_003552 [Scirpophaga incertulas]
MRISAQLWIRDPSCWYLSFMILKLPCNYVIKSFNAYICQTMDPRPIMLVLKLHDLKASMQLCDQIFECVYLPNHGSETHHCRLKCAGPRNTKFENAGPKDGRLKDAGPRDTRVDNTDSRNARIENADPRDTRIDNTDPIDASFEKASPRDAMIEKKSDTYIS